MHTGLQPLSAYTSPDSVQQTEFDMMQTLFIFTSMFMFMFAFVDWSTVALLAGPASMYSSVKHTCAGINTGPSRPYLSVHRQAYSL